MSESSDNSTVELYVYDLTKGIAAIMSPIILGKSEYYHFLTRIFLCWFI